MNVLAIDFGALPPEVNSAKMYSGPGAGPMIDASAAWDGLASQLSSAAASYSSAISELEESWTGPSAASMAAAAAPHAAWMMRIATQAEQAATQAKAAAVAYEAAFAMMVPPPVIAANRSLMAALVAANFLGQNTPAIAATEVQYAEMWAQDAAAMYGYAGSSASASMLAPFTPPAQTTNPAGQAAQGAAAAQAAVMSAATNAHSMMSAIPTMLQGLASSAQAAPAQFGLPSFGSIISDFVQGGDYIDFGLLDASSLTNTAVSSTRNLENLSYQVAGGQPEIKVPWGAVQTPKALAPNLATASSPGSGAVSAGIGRATMIGALSAPQSWAAAAPATSAVSTVLPGGGFSAAPDGGPSGAAGAPGVPGIPISGSGSSTRVPGPKYGFRVTVVPRPMAAG